MNGSSVVVNGQVNLAATNNANIVAATDEQSSYRLHEKKKSSLISTGGNISSQCAGNMANSLLVGVNGSGSSTIRSAVSEGTIIIWQR